jgi:hypothetical protein
VFLAIDSAEVSGVALCSPEEEMRTRISGYDTIGFGECKHQAARESWVGEAVEESRNCQLPLVIVGEAWTPHGMSTAAFASLCESWGKWLAAIESVTNDAGLAPHIVRVPPNTWRAAVFGKRRAKTREGLKAQAVAYCQNALKQPPHLSDNIAEALCLQVWASRASEVHALLAPPKRRKKVA